MSNSALNMAVIHTIAEALGQLNEEVVFVGGAVISLYVDDPAAEDVRPTDDIDITLEIASWAELEAVREKLVAKGFTQTAQEDVMCRFRYGEIKVDVMSTQAVGWALANRWFKPGFNHLETRKIEDKNIRVLSLPYFLASKYEAFKNRGSKDPRASHDLEDVTYLLDNRTDLVKVIAEAPEDVRAYLKQAFGEILKSSVIQEAILGNLDYETQMERFGMIEEALKDIIVDA